MRNKKFFGLLLMAPVIAGLIMLTGCGGGGDKGKGGTATTPPPGPAPAPSGEKTAVEGKGLATLKGKVTIDGQAPTAKDISAQVNMQDDKAHCLKDDPKNHEPGKDRTWVVGKDGGVANVAVWIRPPANKYFKISDEDKKKEVKVDQPFCHFEPHVSVAVAGQKVEVENSAPMSHNTKWKGDARKVPGGNQTIASKGHIDLALQPDWTTPVQLNCDIHKWMEGYIWVLETPFAAVTKEDGTFEIKGIPAGTEVMVVTWQEGQGFGDGGAQGVKKTLTEGDNPFDFKVKAK